MKTNNAYNLCKAILESLRLTDSEYSSLANGYNLESDPEYGDCNISHGDFFWEAISSYGSRSDRFLVTFVESKGGSGQGEYYHNVYHVIDLLNNGKEYYLKYQGFYSSWTETEWESHPVFVVPTEVVITKYELAEVEYDR